MRRSYAPRGQFGNDIMRRKTVDMNTSARVGIASGIATAALMLAAGTANAGETDTIIGQRACESVAKQYRDMGYTARCNHIHDDRYYVSFDKPREGSRPSTGSFGG